MTELSFQLYSARNVPSLEDFLSTLGSLGYKQVEGYGGLTQMLKVCPPV